MFKVQLQVRFVNSIKTSVQPCSLPYQVLTHRLKQSMQVPMRLSYSIFNPELRANMAKVYGVYIKTFAARAKFDKNFFEKVKGSQRATTPVHCVLFAFSD